jgi:RimJ/RimL family protein N-acetyltransferase
MFGWGGIHCGLGGVHRMRQARLTIASARLRDELASGHLLRDPAGSHWMGWGPADVPKIPTRPDRDPVYPLAAGYQPFVGVHRRTGHLVASITLHATGDGGYSVGGMVDPQYRGQGYGTEALFAVCAIAHQHFGIARLIAANERTNLASRRWLSGCGFTETDGPPTLLLPNGRVVESVWWEQIDPTARRRCRKFPDTGTG